MTATTTTAGAGRSTIPQREPGRMALESHVVKARVFSFLKYLSLIVASICSVLPLVVVFITAFKTRQEYLTSGPLDLPANFFNFENFVTAFTDGNMLIGFTNTVFILVISLVGTVLVGTMTAYAIDRFDFKLKKVVIALFLIATLVPGVTTQVATFQVVNNLGLYNSYWAAIALFLGTDVIAIYIFVQFMQGIPKEVDEAAMLDGANKFTIYWRVILPLLKPAIATVVIIKGIAIYNEFYVPFLYMPSEKLSVISTALFRFTGPFGSQWEVIAAGTLLVILPTLILFIFLQKFIYNGLTQGATK
jgi:ABC-type glycerol-3-phosphate transport system permease component